jgi:flagellar motor switch protein FliN/FliY
MPGVTPDERRAVLDPTKPAPTLQQVMRLEVPVVVRLGQRRLSVSEVKILAPGSIIELTKKADSELDLMVNNKEVGCGLAVKVGENFGLRLTFVGDVRSRIEAMGEQPVPEVSDELANKPVAAPAS